MNLPELSVEIWSFIIFVVVVAMCLTALSAPAFQNQVGQAGQQGMANFASITIPFLAPDATSIIIGSVVGIIILLAAAYGYAQWKG